MPASRSRAASANHSAHRSSESIKRPSRARRVVLGLLLPLVAIVFIAIFLPAAVLRFFLPSDVSIEEPSGTVWHGSVARLNAKGNALGSIEWRVRAASLIGGALAARIHWIRGASVIDAEVEARARSFVLRNVRAAGELQDWRDVLPMQGWNGRFMIDASRIALAHGALDGVNGRIDLDGLTTPQQEAVGNYSARFEPSSVPGSARAAVVDRGGPLQVSGSLTLTGNPWLATLSGTLRERPAVPPSIYRLIEDYAALRPQDASGNLPFDFELAL